MLQAFYWMAWVLVLGSQAEALSVCDSGQDLFSDQKLDTTPLQELASVGVSLCGQRCLQQQTNCRSYNYHRASGRCLLLASTSADSPGSLVPASGWFHGNLDTLQQAAMENCSCDAGMTCSREPPSVVRCARVATIYTVRVYTGGWPGGQGGTGADVYVTLNGSLGLSQEWQIDGGYFYEYSVRSVSFSEYSLGPIAQVKLEMKNSQDGWYVVKVDIEMNMNHELTDFPVNSWLDTDSPYSPVLYLSPA